MESRPWRLDPIPLVIDGAEFVELADAAIARMRMLEAILDDLYGVRSLLQDAVVDPVALWGSRKYRLAAFGARPVKRWMTSYAVDVVRTADGRWHVVRDITDAPSGVGYGLLGRVVTGRVHRDVVARLPPDVHCDRWIRSRTASETGSPTSPQRTIHASSCCRVVSTTHRSSNSRTWRPVSG